MSHAHRRLLRCISFRGPGTMSRIYPRRRNDKYRSMRNTPLDWIFIIGYKLEYVECKFAPFDRRPMANTRAITPDIV